MPLEGLRVVVLGAAIAGPTIGRFLAAYGAEVIRIEWTGRLDMRNATPFVGPRPDINSSARFAQYNMGLHSLALDLRQERGRAVFLDLLRKSDVFVCNLGADVLPKLGLGYDVLLQANPRLVAVALTIFGRGKYHDQPGLGGGLAAFTGFDWLTGWPDGEPLLPQGAYTDFIVPPMVLPAILLALEEVHAGAGGKIIDVSQFECASWFLMPQMLEAQTDASSPVRKGHMGVDSAISAVFPCRGDDRWCVITITTDHHWTALIGLMGYGGISPELACLNAHQRLMDRTNLIGAIGEWTQRFDRDELVEMLRRQGIPAVGVSAAPDVDKDPHLAMRHHFRVVEDPIMGPIHSERFPVRFTNFSDRSGPSPEFGGYSYTVLSEILGYSDETCAALAEIGAVE